ncbi:hypothetical protein PoB_000470900 [Plakobranchus ocellatus]|uniref:Uncharacterized protein n=1 Tax=Plakobranchus ocellatus TaxID=259542 RepID=A0AAV3Y7Y2_9GAST|nr:hypothetical protein PoB_000470900 [Plakobranchus ocellatus]
MQKWLVLSLLFKRQFKFSQRQTDDQLLSSAVLTPASLASVISLLSADDNEPPVSLLSNWDANHGLR